MTPIIRLSIDWGPSPSSRPTGAAIFAQASDGVKVLYYAPGEDMTNIFPQLRAEGEGRQKDPATFSSSG